jgi:hypothetical protein
LLIRLGKTREATKLPSELYKSAIREYMESLGYAETKNSAIEGSLPDLVLVPPSDRPWPREIWIESKASKLRLNDRIFVEEVCGYLRRWLALGRGSRFKLMIFAKEIDGPARWEQIWDKDLTKANILKWLGVSALGRQIISEASSRELVTFFMETEIWQTDVDYLRSAVEERSKAGTAAMEIRRRALQSAKFMDEHSNPIPKKSKLVANLMTFQPPSAYLVMEIDQLPRDEVERALKDVSVPYSNPMKGILITIDLTGASERFAVLHTQNVERYEMDDVRKSYRQGFSHLMNSSLSKKVLDSNPRIQRWQKGWYYFLGDQEAKRHASRVIRTLSRRRMQVAKPMYSKGVLNFVFHHAFRINYRSLWEGHFVGLELMRLYTDDGVSVIEGENRSKIDKHFRNSKFNRSETQQARVSKLAEFLFPSETLRESTWSSQFHFGRLLSMGTDWTPQAVDPNQKFISDFEEESLDD